MVFGSPISSMTEKRDASIYSEVKRTRIEGRLHALRGHVDDLTCCCVNVDLDIVVSCSQGVIRPAVVLMLIWTSPSLAHKEDSILIIWDKVTHSLSAVNVNGISLASRGLSLSDSDITSIAVSVDGRYAVVGTSCAKHQQPDAIWYAQSDTSDVPLQKPTENRISSTGGSNSDDNAMSETGNRDQASPSIILFNVHTLQVLHKIKLQPGQDIIALTLNGDCRWATFCLH